MHYVFSTLTCDQLYTQYLESDNPNSLPRSAGQVLIKGGAGVANDRIVTPQGVVTEIDASQMAILMNVDAFRDHVKAGYITVEDKPADAEKVAADMQRRDGSSPLVPQDLPEDQQPKSSAAKPKK
jgi:hypothetical protein